LRPFFLEQQQQFTAFFRPRFVFFSVSAMLMISLAESKPLAGVFSVTDSRSHNWLRQLSLYCVASCFACYAARQSIFSTMIFSPAFSAAWGRLALVGSTFSGGNIGLTIPKVYLS
jgi:hypothetical protein